MRTLSFAEPENPSEEICRPCTPKPAIAVTNEAFASIDALFAFLDRYACRAVEYSFARNALTPEEIVRELPVLGHLQNRGIALRCHFAFKGAEIALADADAAGRALDLFRFSLERVAEFGIDTATVHIGLGRETDRGLDYRIAVDNLGALVAHGKRTGGRVCLENLRLGWTCDPVAFGAFLEASSV